MIQWFVGSVARGERGDVLLDLSRPPPLPTSLVKMQRVGNSNVRGIRVHIPLLSARALRNGMDGSEQVMPVARSIAHVEKPVAGDFSRHSFHSDQAESSAW